MCLYLIAQNQLSLSEFAKVKHHILNANFNHPAKDFVKNLD